MYSRVNDASLLRVCVRVIPSMNVRIKREIRVKRISGGERERERIGKEYESLYEKKEDRNIIEGKKRGIL